MIPKTLRFKAFESYVGEQFIDFSALSKNGIFLINGETGAGKTAILDAMTYALYGETSGGSRGDVRSLHPDAAGIPTEVEFVFALNGTDYKFTRSIKIRERAGKQTVLTEQNALFFDGSTFVPFEANSTRTRVSAKAAELLGLTVEQFRQVILLPQGQFERFLTSDSSEKEQILSTLFDTERFTKISETLYTQARRKAGELHVTKELLTALLTNEGFADFDALSAHLEETAARLAENEVQVKAAQKKLNALKAAISDAEKLASLFGEKALAEKELAALGTQQEEIQCLTATLQKAGNAQKISGLHTDLIKSRRNFEERQTALEAAQNRLDAQLARHEALQKELALLREKEPEIQRLEAEQLRLKALFPAYNDIQKTCEAAKTAEKAFSHAQEKLEKLRADEAQNEKDLQELTAAADKLLTHYVQKIPALTAQKNELSALRNQWNTRRRLESDMAETQAKLAEKDRALEVLDAEIAEKKARFEEAYNLQLQNLTDLLARSLKDGAPCPVCGSTNHPRVHTSDVPHAEAGVKQRKADLDDAQSRRTRLADERGALLSVLEARRLSLAENTAGDTPFSEETFAKAEADLALAFKAEARLGEINRTLAALREKQAESTAAKTALEKEIYTLQSEALSAKTRAESLSAALDSEIPDLEALQRKIAAAQTEAEALKAALNRLTAEYSDSTAASASAKTACAQARDEAGKAERALQAAEKAFDEALALQGFKSVQEFSDSLLTEADTAEMTQKINGYNAQKYAAELRLSTLAPILEGKTEPALAPLREEFSALEENERILTQSLAVAKSEQNRLQKIAADYTEKNRTYLTEMEKNAKFREFAELLQGSRGVSFTRYVLGVMLSLITAEANRLLRDVHGGQFQLYRKTDGTEKNRKTGLELEVQSAMAVSRFSTKNLSGGEKFLISLALSMALSAVLQSQSGGISIEAMFIDEGFGSLDPQSLHEAMGILASIQGSRRTIGIISHVAALKELIPSRIDVTKNLGGSTLKVSV